MVSVILIWIYMAVTTYLVGFGFWFGLPGIRKYTVKKEDSIVFAGIVLVTVYAQIFSLFSKVGLMANLLLAVVCIIIAIGLKRQLREHVQSVRLLVSPVRMLFLVFFFFLFAFGASRGILHYDTGLYHAQSIRWIEEFGVVPGLGNLHGRLAYNSASFALSALYSMRFVGGQSFHACAGFLGFLVAGTCLEGIRRRKAKKVLLSDLVRITAAYYLMNIFDEMISPASDYFMVLIFFYLIIRWLDLLEREERSYIPFGLLCLLGVFLLTVKLSAVLILLLAVKPVLMMLRQKSFGAMAGFMGLGLLTSLPYLLRNRILSGWLLYPSTFPDLFHVDWKIPKGAAAYDFREIQVWGRGYTDVNRYEIPVRQWIGPWFAGQSSVDQIFILAAAATCIILLLMLLHMIARKKWEMANWLLVAGTVSLCFYFWLCSAPLMRYGCVYVWLAPILVYGYLYMCGSPHFDKYIMLYLVLALLGGYKAGTFGRELQGMLPQTREDSYLLLQKDYENYPTIAYRLQGYTFYYAAEGDQTGYDDFPASPVQAADIFRGETIQEGFRHPRRQEEPLMQESGE